MKVVDIQQKSSNASQKSQFIVTLKIMKIGGFPIEIESQISLLITYSLAIFIV